MVCDQTSGAMACRANDCNRQPQDLENKFDPSTIWATTLERCGH